MDRRRLPLNALRAFEAVGRNLNMRRAAEEMCVSHSAVSQQIRKLEQMLDVDLFQRTNKGLQLTPPGSRLLGEVTSAIDNIVKATTMVSQDNAAPELRIACAPGIAADWLVPNIELFLHDYPEYHVRLDPIADLPKEVPSNLDLVMTWGRPAVSEDRVVQLPKSSLLAVCSPQLFQKLGGNPVTPRLIARQTLMHADSGMEWQQWFREAGMPELTSKRNLYLLAGYHLILDAIRRGFGIGLIARRFIENDISQGRLIVPVDKSIAEPEHYYLIRPEDDYRSQAGRMLEQWILAQWSKH
jgi:LysR family glycine cleavage system transcriptional activator